MQTNAQAYFSQTQTGRSNFLDWLAGFWFILIGWIIAQSVITGPIPSIIEDTHPEAMSEFYELMGGMMNDIDPQQMLLFTGGSILFSISTLATWIGYRLTRGLVSKVFGWLCALFIIGSLFFMFRFFQLLNDPEANNLFMQMLGLSPLAYALMLATFPGTLVGVFLVQKFLHKRTITSLHTAASKINWKRIIFAIGLTWIVLGLMVFIGHITGLSPVKFVFDPSRFLGFAIASLLFIPLQSATEEIVFRGYLNQGLSHFIPSIWVVFIITSALFAAMHLSNPEAQAGADAGHGMHLLVMSHYFLFGFIACIIVYFEGGLEGAIGLHAGNNMFAAILVNYEGSVLPTPSIFQVGMNANVDIPMGLLALSIITYLLYRTRPQIIS